MSTPRGPRRSRGLDVMLLVLMLGLGLTSLWGAGVFDSEIAQDVRVSNVYVDDGVDLDEQQAEKIVGNRHLVIVYVAGKLNGPAICDDLQSVADGSIVMIVDQELHSYGCALLPGRDEENFGKAYVAETTMRYGIRTLADDPLAATKAMVSNFDTLVTAGIAPQEARAITPPLSRFIIAGIALGTVVLAALTSHLRSRRLAHLQADALERRATARGRLAERDTALASAGTRILALDEKYRDTSSIPEKDLTAAKTRFLRDYARAIATYTDLNARVTDHDPDDDELEAQLDEIALLNRTLGRL